VRNESEEEVSNESKVKEELYLEDGEVRWMLVAKAKRSGRVSKANKEWIKKFHVQRLLKVKMLESTITQWESVRGCVNRIKGNWAYDDGQRGIQAYDGNNAEENEIVI